MLGHRLRPLLGLAARPAIRTAFVVLFGTTVLVLPAGAQRIIPDRPVDIYVRVYDARTEATLERARLDLMRFPDGILSQAFSDSSGRHTFAQLFPNSYIVRATLTGYQTAEVRFDIRRGDTSREVGVPMEPKPREQVLLQGSISARALKIPESAAKEFSTGLSYLNEKKDPGRSLGYFQRALSISPDYYEAYFLMGMARLQLNENDKAKAAFRKAIELNPEYVEPYYPLAVLLASERRYDEAEGLLLQAMEKDPRGWRWPFELARCYARRNNWEKALTYAEIAQALPNPSSKVHLLLADLYSGLGQKEKAIAELEEFTRVDPQSPYMPKVQQALAELRRPAS